MPVPVITSATYDGIDVGSSYSYQIVATNSPTAYSAAMSPSGLPGGLSINTSTGLLSGVPTTSGTYAINLKAFNGSGGSATVVLSLHIVVTGGTWITSSLTASGVVGTPFTYTMTGSNSPTSFQATNLPPGLTYDGGTGVISGTPTTAGGYTPTLKSHNIHNLDGVVAQFTITGGAAVPVITSDLTELYTVGDTVSYQITATNTPTSYAASPLPAGLSVNTSTGLITGTVTTAATTNTVLHATNGTGQGPDSTLIIVVQATGGGGSIPPSGIPKGQFAYLGIEENVPSFILTHPAVAGISLPCRWSVLEPTQNNYDFSYWTAQIKRVAPTGKKVLIRPKTGSGAFSQGGQVPDYVLSLMGADPSSKDIIPGVTYTFNNNANVVCIPVWWHAIYHARKAAMYAAVGDWLMNTPDLTQDEKDCVVIVALSICNAVTEDWNVPASSGTQNTGGPDGTGYDRTELQRWLDATNDMTHPGAGYTPTLVIDSAIKSDNTGLIDVAMAAFPGKFLTLATNKNVTALDDPDNSGDGHYVARTIVNAAYTKYPGRWITQRNNVMSSQPLESVATGTTWALMRELTEAGKSVAGQALSAVWGDTVDTGGNGYRMNGGSPDDPDGVLPSPITASQVYRKSGERLRSYNANYYEVYEKDLGNQAPSDMLYVHQLFTGDTSPNAPVIDSPLTADVTLPDSLQYQITATNSPTGYGGHFVGGPTNHIQLSVNAVTGALSFRTQVAGDYIVTILASNSDGTGQADLTITVTAADLPPPPPPPVPPPAEVSLGAFPEVSTFSEDDRDPCQEYIDKLNAGPPSAPLNVVVTPTGPGTATVTWDPPLNK